VSFYLVVFSLSQNVYAKKKEITTLSTVKSKQKSRIVFPLRFDYSVELQAGLEQRSFVPESQSLLKDKYALVTNAGFTSTSFDLKWKADNYRIVARPAFLGLLQVNKFADKQNKTKFEQKSKADFKELFTVWVPSGDSSITLGRQKYEWGPAELYNVSNPFVILNPHESFTHTFTVSPVLVKASQSFHKSWNLSLLADLETKKEIVDGAYVAKLENASTEGDFVFGTTYGKGKITPQFIGLYGRWSHSSGFSVYTDSKQTSGSAAYYPVDKGGGGGPLIELQDKYFNSSKKFIMSILGLRWEDKWDLRFEYLYNGAGYNKSEIENLPLAFIPTNPYVQANVNSLAQLHLPFLQQNYFYFSSRSPQFGFQKKYHLNFNIIQNHDDKSWLATAKLEREVGESGSLIFTATQSNGNSTMGEYSNYLKNYYSCFLKWMF
jgi:hypothetical protein